MIEPSFEVIFLYSVIWYLASLQRNCVFFSVWWWWWYWAIFWDCGSRSERRTKSQW